MVDLCMKYVCRSSIVLVETNFFGIPFRYFSVFWWHRLTYFCWVKQERTGIYVIPPEFLRKIQPRQRVIEHLDQICIIC